MNEFLRSYYGKAARPIRNIDLLTIASSGSNIPRSHFRHPPTKPYLDLACCARPMTFGKRPRDWPPEIPAV